MRISIRRCFLLVTVVVSVVAIIYKQTVTDFVLNTCLRLLSRQNVTRSSPLSADQQQIQREDVVMQVHSAGNFPERLVAFNAFLSSFRVEELKRRGNETWRKPTSNQLKVVWSAKDNYLELLSYYSHVTTVVLP